MSAPRCIADQCPYEAGTRCTRYPCAGRSKFTPDHMRAMWKDGEPMSVIAAKAYRELGIGKERVRAFVFGDDA